MEKEYFLVRNSYTFLFQIPDTKLAAYLSMLLQEKITRSDHEFSFEVVGNEELVNQVGEPTEYFVENKSRILRSLSTCILKNDTYKDKWTELKSYTPIDRAKELESYSISLLTAVQKAKFNFANPYTKIIQILNYLK